MSQTQDLSVELMIEWYSDLFCTELQISFN